MRLVDIYSELRIPHNDIGPSSGRNETTNTIALVIDRSSLREADPDERRNGIALVHEVTGTEDCDHGTQLLSRAAFVRDDLVHAYAEDCWVRAIVCDHIGIQAGFRRADWHLLPNLGRVVELDEEARTYKIVFFERNHPWTCS
jgi:hypothetical protein